MTLGSTAVKSENIMFDPEAWELAGRLNGQIKCLACGVVVHEFPLDSHYNALQLEAYENRPMLHFCEECRNTLKDDNGQWVKGVKTMIKKQQHELLAITIINLNIKRYGKNRKNHNSRGTASRPS